MKVLHKDKLYQIKQRNPMHYRLAEENDLDAVCSLAEAAVKNMEQHGIFQWDNLYPTKEDFLDDIQKRQLFVGLSKNDIAVIFAVNKESDEEYQNGKWNYPSCDYRVIHRLCVVPAYQNRGVARDTLFHIENELRKQGVETIRLDVFSENPFTLSLYRNNGYKQVEHQRARLAKSFAFCLNNLYSCTFRYNKKSALPIGEKEDFI